MEMMPAKYKRPNNLSIADAAYLAGLIDGEGTIALTRKQRGGHRQLFVSISSTERYILEYVLIVVGAGKITNKRASQPHHSPSWAYSIANRQALTLLKQIAAYLRSYKARRAELILNDYLRLTPRNGKYSPKQLNDRDHFVARFLDIRANTIDQTVRSDHERAREAGSV